jgi:hypothetical protein
MDPSTMDFLQDWWMALLIGLYLIGGWFINSAASKKMENIGAYYNSREHMTEEDVERRTRSESEVRTDQSLQFIHFLLGITVVLLAGILATLLRGAN